MAKLTKSQWRHVADLLNKRCNYTGLAATACEVLMSKRDIEVIPADSASPDTLHCVGDVVDVCRAYGLSYYVAVTGDTHCKSGRVCIRIF